MSAVHLESELQDLKEKLSEVGGQVETALRLSLECLFTRSTDSFDRIMELEERINQSQVKIDETCFQIIALKSPRAGDLRFVLASYRINNDLERMGDHCVGIARNSKDFIKRAVGTVETSFEPMAKEVIGMVTSALNSFVRVDEKLARNVLDRDDWVDEQRNSLFSEMKEKIKRDPENLDAYLDLLLIARNLERVADLSTNIAEDAIFLTSGVDVRHKLQGETDG